MGLILFVCVFVFVVIVIANALGRLQGADSMSDEQQQPTDSNPLSVDMAMDLIGKWETHPGLLMAIFDAARKLRDEVELLRDELQRSQDWSNAVASELQTAQHNNERLIEHVKDINKERSVMQNDLEHLKSAVAQNNASLSSIVMRWIQPSKN